MAKPEITASVADPAPDAPPPAQATSAQTPASARPAVTEVTPAPVASAPARAKSEKALRLAQALRANLKRRKLAVRPARPSN